MQVSCEHPRIIINPKLPELILKYKHWVLNGYEYKKKYYNCHPDDFIWRDFSVRRNGITIDNYENSYVIDDETGECFMMYLAVPCGHCDICKVSKINSFVKRCEYESQMYSVQPWFVTLTYAHDPDEGVNVRDCQLFLKRFRVNLERAGYKDKIRYVLVAEYGKKGRSHYHAIFWNIHSTDHVRFLEVKNILYGSWKHGFIRSRLMDLKDDKGFYYTTKYLKKGCEVPKGKNDTFVLSSRGTGGIGAPFIDKIKDQVRKSLNCEFKFKNRWTGKVEVVQWSRYVLNRIFPSFCRSVSSKFRNAVHDYVYYFNQFIRFHRWFGKDLFNFEIQLRSRLSKFMYIPYGFDVQCPNHGQCDASYLDSLKLFIESKIDLFDFDFCQKIDLLRKKFLGRLFRYQSTFDLVSRKRKCADILSWESPRTCYV